MIRPLSTRVLTCMMKFYSSHKKEHISEEIHHDLFVIHESSDKHDKILFFSSKWVYKWRDSEWFVHRSRECWHIW
jgi:hypothetical protein